jgi:diacylglycerol kinase family enzyme
MQKMIWINSSVEEEATRIIHFSINNNNNNKTLLVLSHLVLMGESLENLIVVESNGRHEIIQMILKMIFSEALHNSNKTHNSINLAFNQCKSRYMELNLQMKTI